MDPAKTTPGQQTTGTGESVTTQQPDGAPEGMPADTEDTPAEGESADGAEETPAEGDDAEPVAATPESTPEPDETTLAKNPAVQRMLKKAADKAAREAAQKIAEEAAKKAKRAKMSEEQRRAAEAEEHRAEAEAARADATAARVELEFYRGLTAAKLTPVDEDAAEFIKQAAVKIAEDEGIEIRHAISEVARKKPYLFDRGETPAADDGAGAPTTQQGGRTTTTTATQAAPKPAPAAPKPKPSTTPAPRRDNAAPPTQAPPKVDARTMSKEEFAVHLQKAHGLAGVPT